VTDPTPAPCVAAYLEPCPHVTSGREQDCPPSGAYRADGLAPCLGCAGGAQRRVVHPEIPAIPQTDHDDEVEKAKRFWGEQTRAGHDEIVRDLETALAASQAEHDGPTPGQISEQREKGWPDFHPEDYCHECAAPNPGWFTPDWLEAFPGHGGIVCPRCFALRADPDKLSTWILTRYTRHDEDSQDRLAAFLRHCSGLEPDSENDRLATCILDAGYRHWSDEGLDASIPVADVLAIIDAERERLRANTGLSTAHRTTAMAECDAIRAAVEAAATETRTT